MKNQKSFSGGANKLVGQADQAVSQQIEDLRAALLELIEHPAIANVPDLDDVKERVRTQVVETSHALQSAKDSASAAISTKADGIDEYVHEEPWKVAGVAAALGLALGVLISKR